MKNKKSLTKQGKKEKIIKQNKTKTTKEEKKLIRAFMMILTWTLFAALTASGLLFAAARTAYIQEGKEYETVSLNDFSVTSFFASISS